MASVKVLPPSFKLVTGMAAGLAVLAALAPQVATKMVLHFWPSANSVEVQHWSALLAQALLSAVLLGLGTVFGLLTYRAYTAETRDSSYVVACSLIAVGLLFVGGLALWHLP